MICLFGHNWKAVAVYHTWDTGWGSRAASTMVTLRCKDCGKIKTKYMYGAGFLELDQLK